MLSEDLQKRGFIEWLPFTLVEQSRLIGELPQSDGVYVIRSSKSFGRYKGESDIVYVGSSANATGTSAITNVTTIANAINLFNLFITFSPWFEVNR